MISRRDRIYAGLPEPVTGYELNPEHGLFSVIIPEATTNLVTNPGFYGGVTTGYTAVAGAIAAVATWQAHGAYGLRITPAASTESGVYYGTVSLTSGTTYTFSVTVQGEAGKLYYLYFGTTGGAVLGSKKPWLGTGHKQRISVTYTETSSTTRRVYLTRDAAYADTNYFYADGFQVEAKSYATTYTDGDQVGFVVNETPAPYLWNGAPHASTSSRSAQTRSGGREMNLLDLGLRILAVIGLGMMPLVDQSLPMPGLGELPQGTGTMARNFTLVGDIDGSGFRHLNAVISGLEDAFNPDIVTHNQTMLLRYQAYEDDEPCGDLIDIPCKYLTGLEGVRDNNYQERVSLSFKMYLPFLKSTYSTGTVLGYQTSVPNAGGLLQQSVSGVWSDVGGGLTAWGVEAITIGLDGIVYIGGGFRNQGSADGDGIAAWNPFTSSWSALGTGVADGSVYTLVTGPDGCIYAGGSFTQMGGVADTARIAKWDPNTSTWSALGTGASSEVYTLVFDKDGILYAGGDFTNLGTANGDYIAKWDGAAWTALGTGANGKVGSIVAAPDGTIYAGGNFTLMGGVAGTVYIAQWNGSTWSPLGSGADDSVNALTLGKDMELYAGGEFATIGGVSAAYIARWNGSIWAPLGIGANANVLTLFTMSNGNILAGGNFTAMNGITLPSRAAVWNGSVWGALDVVFSWNLLFPWAYAEFNGTRYIGMDVNLTTATSSTVTVTNITSGRVYPIITFIGPGTVWQLRSYTTGKVIYFLDLTLLAGETATLNLDPLHLSFVSSFRGSLMGTILPGSNMNFPLLPGANNLSTYIYGNTSVTTAVTAHWQNQSNSLNGTVWK